MKKSILLGIALLALSSHGVLAEEAPAPRSNDSLDNRRTNELTSEQRKRMAAAHEKMAQCLRSDRPWNECRLQMHDQCMEMMGRDGCLMWQMGGMMGSSTNRRGTTQDTENKR